jgi:hypothetical protein
MLHIYETRFIKFMIEANNMILIMIYCNPLHIQINCVSKTYVTLILPRLSEIGYWGILTKILYEFFISYGQIPNNFIPAYMCIYEFIASAFLCLLIMLLFMFRQHNHVRRRIHTQRLVTCEAAGGVPFPISYVLRPDEPSVCDSGHKARQMSHFAWWTKYCIMRFV